MSRSHPAPGGSIAIVPQFHLVAVLGPAGHAMTTLMRMVGCPETPSGGPVAMDGETLRGPDRRRSGVVPFFG